MDLNCLAFFTVKPSPDFLVWFAHFPTQISGEARSISSHYSHLIFVTIFKIKVPGLINTEQTNDTWIQSDLLNLKLKWTCWHYSKFCNMTVALGHSVQPNVSCS